MYDRADLLIVGDFPSQDGSLPPLYEPKFDLFWKIAKEVCHIDPLIVQQAYATKCQPPEGKRPSTEQNATCASTYLKKEIWQVRPKAVLLLGTLPAAAFGYTEQISKLRGTHKQVTIKKGEDTHTFTLVFAQSPGFVQYNSNELQKFAEDINKAWQIANGQDPDDKPSPTKVTLCDTLDKVEELISYIHQTKQCTFDFETNKLDDMGVFSPNFYATLVAFSFQHGSAYTIPLFHFDSPFTKEEVMHILKRLSDEVWANPEIHKINQNIKFDMHVAARYGFHIFRGRVDCTMVMHSLYDDLNKHGIKEWLPTFFPEFQGWELTVKGQAWDKIPLATLSQYAGVDADGAFRGFTVLQAKLLEDDRVYDLYRNLYMFVLRPLFNMERRGMLMSRENLLKYEARALELIEAQIIKMNNYPVVRRFNEHMRSKVTLAALEEAKEKYANAKTDKLRAKYKEKYQAIKQGKIEVYEGINYGSPDQLNELLYTRHGFAFQIPYDKKTRGPKASTGEVVVKALKDKSGFIDDLLVLRSLQGTYGKYLYGLRMLLDENDRIHTSYSQSRVKTGRLSSSNPNLQNITTHVKIKNPLIEEIIPYPKKCFITTAGRSIINNDASQAELRMIAEFSNCKAMIDAYMTDKDLHSVTAANINKQTFEEFMAMSKEEKAPSRQKGKSANFGLVFDISIEGFKDYALNAYNVVLTLAEATEIYNAFFELYPEIKEYHEIYRAKCRKYGYVRSLFGRKMRYPDINSNDKFLRGNAERECINAPIQSSNGEMTLFALAFLDITLPKSVVILNSVHDSIMEDAPDNLVNYAAKLTRDTWENLPIEKYFGKPMVHLGMKIDCEVSKENWKDLTKYEILK